MVNIIFYPFNASAPPTISNISLVIEKLETITADMPKVVYEQCLASYKKIVQNAVKNYQEFQKSAAAWQKKVESKNQSSDFVYFVFFCFFRVFF